MALEIIESQIINELLNGIKIIQAQLTTQKIEYERPLTNEEVKKYLGVGDTTLRKYRDAGLLAYSKVDDKYWYTKKDLDCFLQNHRQETYIN